MGGETHTAQHAQRVVREGDIGIERRTDKLVLHVVKSVKGIDKFAEAVTVQTNRQSIDGKIATVLVVFQRTILHMRLAAVMTITLLAGTHKLHFHTATLHLGGAEITENREMSLAPKLLFQRFSHLYATPHHHNINIVGRSFEKEVADIASHHVALHAKVVSHTTDLSENIFIKQLCQFGICKISHYSSFGCKGSASRA